MTRICWWLVDKLSRVLEPIERDVVCGDFAESHETGAQALRDVLGLVVRRQMALWRHWPLWLVLVGVVAPLGMLLSLVSRRVADSTAIYAWMYLNNLDWSYLQHRAFWIILAQTIPSLLLNNVALICLSWTIGSVLGALSRRAIPINGALFCLVLLFGELVAAPWYAQLQQHLFLGALGRHGANHLHDNDAVFALTFYRVMFPLLVQVILVLLPSLWGICNGLGMIRMPLLLRAIIWAPAIAIMAVLATWQGVWWAALETHNGVWLLRSWQMPALSFAIAGPIMYWISMASWKRWHPSAA